MSVLKTGTRVRLCATWQMFRIGRGALWIWILKRATFLMRHFRQSTGSAHTGPVGFPKGRRDISTLKIQSTGDTFADTRFPKIMKNRALPTIAQSLSLALLYLCAPGAIAPTFAADATSESISRWWPVQAVPKA